MRLEGPARRLTAFIGEEDVYEGKSLYTALMDAARAAGCAGATVVKCLGGFGATSRMHSRHDLRMSEDLPVVVTVVDAAHRIEALGEVFDAMVGDGLIIVEEVEVIAYRGGATGGPEP